jgi:hypothetical protein
MKFGCPALFNFEVTDLYLCILHTLLRLIAVVFKRTIVVNLDTLEKVDAVNQFVKEAHLGCKKVAQRKKDGKKKKDTEDTAFTGRFVPQSSLLAHVSGLRCACSVLCYNPLYQNQLKLPCCAICYDVICCHAATL